MSYLGFFASKCKSRKGSFDFAIFFYYSDQFYLPFFEIKKKKIGIFFSISRNFFGHLSFTGVNGVVRYLGSIWRGFLSFCPCKFMVSSLSWEVTWTFLANHLHRNLPLEGWRRIPKCFCLFEKKKNDWKLDSCYRMLK